MEGPASHLRPYPTELFASLGATIPMETKDQRSERESRITSLEESTVPSNPEGNAFDRLSRTLPGTEDSSGISMNGIGASLVDLDAETSLPEEPDEEEVDLSEVCEISGPPTFMGMGVSFLGPPVSEWDGEAVTEPEKEGTRKWAKKQRTRLGRIIKKRKQRVQEVLGSKRITIQERNLVLASALVAGTILNADRAKKIHVRLTADAAKAPKRLEADHQKAPSIDEIALALGKSFHRKLKLMIKVVNREGLTTETTATFARKFSDFARRFSSLNGVRRKEEYQVLQELADKFDEEYSDGYHDDLGFQLYSNADFKVL